MNREMEIELFGVNTRPFSIIEMLSDPLTILLSPEDIFQIEAAAVQNLAPTIPSAMVQGQRGRCIAMIVASPNVPPGCYE